MEGNKAFNYQYHITDNNGRTFRTFEEFSVFLNDVYYDAVKNLKAQVIQVLKSTGAHDKIEALGDRYIDENCIEWGIKRLLDYSIVRQTSDDIKFRSSLYSILMSAFCSMYETDIVFQRELLGEEYYGTSASIIDSYNDDIEEFLKPRAEILEEFGITQFMVSYKNI